MKKKRSRQEFITFLYNKDKKDISLGITGAEKGCFSNHSFQFLKENHKYIRGFGYTLCRLEFTDEAKGRFYYAKRSKKVRISGCRLGLKKKKGKMLATIKIKDIEVKTEKGVTYYSGIYVLQYDKKKNSVKEIKLKYEEV